MEKKENLNLSDVEQNQISEPLGEKESDVPKKQAKKQSEELKEIMTEKTVVENDAETAKVELKQEENLQKEKIKTDDDVKIENKTKNIVAEEISLGNNKETIEEAAEKNTIPIEDVKKEAEEEIKEVDYTQISKEELVAVLKRLIENEPVQKIKNDVDVIKTNFYKKHHAEIEEKKKKFVEAGGDAEDFTYGENVSEENLKAYLQRYKELRTEYNSNIEKEKEKNLILKYTIIEEIKNLVHKEESVNKTFQEFRELQKRWGEIGLVPQAKLKGLWETYNLHVDNFYNYIKINKELRDLDLKKNLDIKIKFCEKAEELLLNEDIIIASKELQKLHEEWREIGPAPTEKGDEIWERFKQATGKINNKQQEYFEERKKEQEQSLLAKQVICETIEQFNEIMYNSHKEWEEKTNKVLDLQKLWNTIGPVPRKFNNTIYQRLRTSCDVFFNRKKEFYSQLKGEQTNNLQLKTDICIQAEAIQNSTEWKKTSDDFFNLQKKWKTIGPVPKKDSDVVWKRFRTACDVFFNKKAEFFASRADLEVENMNKKNELIEKISNFTIASNIEEDLKTLKQFQKEWTEIGHVPHKFKSELYNNYRNAINKLFDKLEMDDNKKEIFKFKIKAEGILKQHNAKEKIYDEKENITKKLKKIENDVITLENNIGFFANSPNAESIINEMKSKIDNERKSVKLLKSKLDIINKMKFEENSTN